MEKYRAIPQGYMTAGAVAKKMGVTVRTLQHYDTDIGLSDVQLRDPALPIPLFRAESKENLARLLRLDPRNNHLLLYLPADLGSVNNDIREVLVSHLLTDRDKDYISGWIHSGENNRGLAMRLSEALASRDGTVTLETRDSADYFASTTSLGVDILDKFDTRLSMSWDEIAPVLRALWLQELDGFTHEPVQRKPVNLEGKLSYQVGDKVAFAYGDHDVSGTIEYIGDLGVRIHTGPYAWSHQLVEKDFFEDAVRHDERNVHLFTPEVPEQAAPEAPAPEAPAPGPAPGTATLYPGEQLIHTSPMRCNLQCFIHTRVLSTIVVIFMNSIMTEKAFDTGTKSPLDIFPNPFCIISSLNWLQIPHNVVFQQFMVFQVQTSGIKYLKYGIGILLR